MKMATRKLLCLLIAVVATLGAMAQPNRTELESKRLRILQEIKESQAQLEVTKKDKTATLSQLRALQAKLSARQSLISNINDEIGSISSTIALSESELEKLNTKLSLLKMRYAQSVRYAYRNRTSYNTLAFIFAATSYNDAVRRLKYLKRYRDYRTRQAEEIRNTKGFIAKKINVLSVERTQKDMLRTAEEAQRQVLQNETSEKNSVVNQLKGREKELMASIVKNQKAQRQLDKTIGDIIRREVEIARKKAEDDRKKKEEEAKRIAAADAVRKAADEKRRLEEANKYGTGPNKVGLATGSGNPAGPTPKPAVTKPAATGTKPAGTTPAVAATAPKPRTPKVAAPVNLNLTPEAAALANSFAASKGRLPWPVEKGIIVSAFGTHKHPLYEKVTVENNGIDIQTSAGASARAVFDGVVTTIFYVPGFGQNVMISHGDYYTVYANLSSVTVKKGDAVRTKQPIGAVGTNDEGQPLIKFSVWKGAAKMNPAAWIAQ